MPTGLIRLITTQKVLKTWSVKGMKQHYLGSNPYYSIVVLGSSTEMGFLHGND